MTSRWYNQKSTNTNTLVGKVSNWDFTVTRASTSTLTLSRSDLNKQDIAYIEHIREWDVAGIYWDMVDIDLSWNIVTITQRSIAWPVHEFLTTDTFIVYTSISRTDTDVKITDSVFQKVWDKVTLTEWTTTDTRTYTLSWTTVLTKTITYTDSTKETIDFISKS